MRSFALKLGLLVCIWYEVSAETGLGADAAFLASIAALVGVYAAFHTIKSLVLNFGPMTVTLLLPAAAWAVILMNYAPPILREQPVIFDVCLFIGLGLAGVSLRRRIARRAMQRRMPWSQGRKILAVSTFMIVLTSFVVARHTVASLWPYLPYVLLPVLPVAMGYRLATPYSPERNDAREGDPGTFRKAGFSEDR